MAKRKVKIPNTWADAVMAGVDSINEALDGDGILPRRRLRRLGRGRGGVRRTCQAAGSAVR